MGKSCELNGVCYDDLRPMGALLWFALPGWLGVPQQYLIFVNLFLIFTSVAISTFAIKRFSELSLSSNSRSAGYFLAIFLCSTVAHGVFFFPLWNTSLTDTPSALFALIAVSCLLISGMNEKISPWLIGFAGILMGAAAWVRAFYLYPFLCVLGCAVIAWLFAPRRRMGLLPIFLGLIPIFIQFQKTYEHHGYWSFISQEKRDNWVDEHLNNSLVKGYDTLLPAKGHRWPYNCNSSHGPWAALTSGYLQEAACFYSGKLDYYLGSYSPAAYPFYNDQGLLILSDEIGGEPFWKNTNVLVQSNCEKTPSGKDLAEQIFVEIPNADTGANVKSWADVYTSGPYVFSSLLWAKTEQKVDMAILSGIDGHVMAHRTVKLSKKPKRFHVSARHEKTEAATSSLGVLIGKIPGSEATFGSDEEDSFYAWAAKLEASSKMTPYSTETNRVIRYWSKSLLGLNLLLSVLALLLIVKGWSVIGLEGKLSLLFVGASFGLALLIVPEQRFFVLLHVFIWTFGLSYLPLLVRSKFVGTRQLLCQPYRVPKRKESYDAERAVDDTPQKGNSTNLSAYQRRGND